MDANNVQKRILNELRNSGARITENRTAVIAIFIQHGRPLSVEEIMHLLENDEKGVNKTTVYREMDFLVENGIVREIQLGHDRKRFELAVGPHHHHIRCLDCDRIVDIEIPRELEHASKHIQKKTGFEVIDHSLEFIGRCSDCAASA